MWQIPWPLNWRGTSLRTAARRGGRTAIAKHPPDLEFRTAQPLATVASSSARPPASYSNYAEHLFPLTSRDRKQRNANAEPVSQYALLRCFVLHCATTCVARMAETSYYETRRVQCPLCLSMSPNLLLRLHILPCLILIAASKACSLPQPFSNGAWAVCYANHTLQSRLPGVNGSNDHVLPPTMSGSVSRC